MNVKGLYTYIIIVIVIFTSLSIIGCQDRALNVEDENIYEWQKYMNEEEFKQLESGMSYMDVVKVAGGAGLEVDTSVYEWRDEILMTRAYLVYFEDGKLTNIEIIEKRGSSTR